MQGGQWHRRKTKIILCWLLAGILFFLFLFILSPIGQAQTSQELQTDAVYLLDVTSSMVGVDGQDILNDVIDRLLLDIERFPGGKFVLMTFADGPYDLDGPIGPIRAIYNVDIRSDQDKILLKRFLRPQGFKIGNKEYSGYGPFPDDPNWPGVYAAVKRSGNVIGPTGVYKAILQGLDILEKSQKEGSADYATTHSQELFVYTDGRNNAIPSPSFDDVLKRLKDRNFNMVERFRYTRYLFSRDQGDIKNAEGECKDIEQSGAAGYIKNVATSDVSQLVILELDRQILGFPNIWSAPTGQDSQTVVLRHIQINYNPQQEQWLEGGQLVIQPLKSEDLGLPGDIAIRVGTKPATLRFPLKEFDLSLTFAPFSRLVTYLDQAKKARLTGPLHLSFLMKGEQQVSLVGEHACKLVAQQQGAVVDVRNSSPLLDVPFVRPGLVVAVTRSAENQLRVDLTPNQVFDQLTEEQRKVLLSVLPPAYQGSLADENGAPLAWGTPYLLPSRPATLFITFNQEIACGKLDDLELRISSPFVGLLMNGETRSAVSFHYRLQTIAIRPPQIATVNLWAAEQWNPGATEPASSALTVEMCSSAAGRLGVLVKDTQVPAQIHVDPAVVGIEASSGQELNFMLKVQPQTDWEALGQALQSSGPHADLQITFESQEDDVLTVMPRSLPVVLTYHPRYVALKIRSLAQGKAAPGAGVYQLQIQGVGVPSDKPLLVLEGSSDVWRVQRNDTTEVLSLSERLLMQSGSYTLQLQPNLPRSTQEGALSFSTQEDYPLLLQFNQQEERHVDGQYRLSYSLQVEALLALIRCSTSSENSRWHRGQVLLHCEPSAGGIPSDQVAQIQIIPNCDRGLALRTGQIDQRCGVVLPLKPFDVAVAADAPAGNLVAQMANHFDVAAQNLATQKTIDTQLEKPLVHGYLFPKTYDQFWEPILRWLLWLVWGVGLVALAGAVTYAVIWMRDNPLSFLINNVWYDERWRWLTACWLAVGVFIGLVEAGIGLGMSWVYGA